jgi:hypothetical protein
MAGKLHSSSSQPPFLRVAYSAPTPREATAEDIRRFMLPTTKALPFVKLKANDQPMWRPESFWHVEPTGKRREMDVRQGRKHAREAIAAMRADHNSHLIAYIIQDIIKDAVQRQGQRGLGRRNAVVLGFLSEISEAIAATQSLPAVHSLNCGFGRRPGQ